MPIRWDEKNKLTLLLRIVERCPPGPDDLKWVLDNWPDSEKPTLRAIQEQMKSLRKQITNGPSPKTPRKNVSTSKIKFASTPTKATALHAGHRKKRKLRDSDIEEERPVLTDSEEENAEAMDTSSDGGNLSSLTPTKRVLPARGKSRDLKLSYNNDNGSESNPDDTKEESEFDDQEFGGGEKYADDKRSVASKRSWRTALEFQAGSEDEV